MSPASISATTALKVVFLAILYYPFSIGLTFYQKWFIKDFKFPLTVVCCHYFIKFFFAAAIRSVYSRLSGESRITLDWKECVLRVAPAGLAASVDIGLSNWAFEYITISLYTMAKSSCIVFILIFAVLLSLEKLKVSLLGVVFLISLGLFLFTYRSTQFDMLGFVLVELAAMCAGVRFALCQLIMQRSEMGLKNPVDMIFHVQPWMILSILPLAFAFEGAALSVSAKTFEYTNVGVPLSFLMKICVGGMIALCMELSEYLLLVNTSSLTLSILGIFKEMATLLLAHFANKDTMTLLNFCGLLLCLSGIGLHTYTKTRANPQVVGSDKKNDAALTKLLDERSDESDS